MTEIIIGEKVINKNGMMGTILSFDGEYINVDFKIRVATLQRDAFEKGFLKYENAELQQEIDEGIEKVRKDEEEKINKRNAVLEKIKWDRKSVEDRSPFGVEIRSAVVRLEPANVNLNPVRKRDKALLQQVFDQCDKDIMEIYENSFFPEMEYPKYRFDSTSKYCVGFLCKYADTYVLRVFSRNDRYVRYWDGSIVVTFSDTTEILRILSVNGKVYFFSKNNSCTNGRVSNTNAYKTWHISELGGAVMLNEVIKMCDCGYLNDYISERKVECLQYAKLLFPAFFNNKVEIVFKNKLFMSAHRIDNIAAYLEEFSSKQIDFASKNNVINALPFIKSCGVYDVDILRRAEVLMKKRRDNTCVYDKLKEKLGNLNIVCPDLDKKMVNFLRKVNFFSGSMYQEYIDEIAETEDVTLNDFFDKNYADRLEYLLLDKVVRYDSTENQAYHKAAKDLMWIDREDNGYFITIPKSIEDFRYEGDKQHNCVFTNRYFGNVIRRRSIVVFLRKEKNTPYVTIEFDYETFDVLQAYGKYNSLLNDDLYQYIVDLGKKLYCEMLSQEQVVKPQKTCQDNNF